MKNDCFRKTLVLGIIMLFVGASVIPSISGDIKQITTTIIGSTISSGSRDYIRYDDFEDYYVGEPPKSERGWSTGGITENQYVEACVDPLDPDNMVMKIHGSDLDPDKYCSLQQMYFGPPGSYVIHYRIYSPDLSMQATIYEDFSEHDTSGMANIHRNTARIAWFEGALPIVHEFDPPIDASTTNWIEEEFTITADEVHLFHDDSIDTVGGFRWPVEIGIESWDIQAFRLATQDFYIDDFWITEYGTLPVADFSWTPQYPNPGETITFNASASYDPDGTIELYEWDFDNDGQYDDATGIYPTWQWSETGEYLVSLKVTDNEGLIGTETKTVYVGYPFDPPEWVWILKTLSGSEEEWKGDHWYIDLSFGSYYLGSINGDLPVHANLGEYFGGSYLSDGFFGSSIEVFMYPEDPSRDKVVFQPDEMTLFKFDILGNKGKIYADLDAVFDNNLEFESLKLDTGGKIKINLPGINWYIEQIKLGIKLQPYVMVKGGTYIVFNAPDEWIVSGSDVSNYIDYVGGYFGLGAGIELAGGIIIFAVEADCGGSGTWYFKPPTNGDFFDYFEAEIYLKVHIYLFLIIDITIIDESWTFRYPDAIPESFMQPPNPNEPLNLDIGFLPRDYNEPIWTGNNSGILIEEVFPSAAPNIDSNSMQKLMVWAYDNQEKPHVDGIELQYAVWNGDGWSEPGFVTDDEFFEIMPSVVFLENGDALCVFNYVPKHVETPEDIFEEVRIAYSYWDYDLDEWTPVEVVAETDEWMDQYPIVAADGDSAVVVWVCDKGEEGSVAYASFWDDGDWHDTQVIYSGTIISPPSVCYHDGVCYYTFVVDEDGDCQYYIDQEVYLVRFTSSGVQSTVRLTYDDLQDASPSVGCDDGVPVITWVKKDEKEDVLMYQKDMDGEIVTVASGSISDPSILFTQENDDMIIGYTNHSENSLYYLEDTSSGWVSSCLYPSSRKFSHVDWAVDDAEISAVMVERENESLHNRRLSYIRQFEPPEKPVPPSGPISGNIDVQYNYSSTTFDLNGDRLFYKWSWGDGSYSDWLGPYESGEIVEASHTWAEQGTYELRVKAMDTQGDESDWSDPLSVTMPRNRIVNRPFLNFLESHPILYQLLLRFLRL